MTGTIPENLRLRRMYYLDLGFNNFSGTLPEDIGTEFVRARYMYFDHNKFHGTIPSNYGMIGNGQVYELYINDNELQGALPDKWVHPNLFISGFRVHNNNFDVEIGNEICKELNVFEEGELVDLAADCNICKCKTLCENCYN